jgi:hypothetical protein
MNPSSKSRTNKIFHIFQDMFYWPNLGIYFNCILLHISSPECHSSILMDIFPRKYFYKESILLRNSNNCIGCNIFDKGKHTFHMCNWWMRNMKLDTFWYINFDEDTKRNILGNCLKKCRKRNYLCISGSCNHNKHLNTLKNSNPHYNYSDTYFTPDISNLLIDCRTNKHCKTNINYTIMSTKDILL